MPRDKQRKTTKLIAIGTSINLFRFLETKRSTGTQSSGNCTQQLLLLTVRLAALALLAPLSTIAASTKTNLSSATTKMTAFIVVATLKQLASPFRN